MKMKFSFIWSRGSRDFILGHLMRLSRNYYEAGGER